MQPPPLFLTAPKAAGGSNLPVMQDDSIHWNGEPIAVVLAETQEQADHAALADRGRLRVLDAANVRGGQDASAHAGQPRRPAGRGSRRRCRGRARRRTSLGRPHLPHAAPQPQRDRAPRGDARVGRRRPDRPRRQPGREAARLDVGAGLRDRRESGSSHLALRRRRVRRQDGVVAPSARGGRVQARRASRADHATP